MTVWESIIKVDVSDTRERRARDVKEGIGYACALLMDEYGISADDIVVVLDMVADEIRDVEEQRSATSQERPASRATEREAQAPLTETD